MTWASKFQNVSFCEQYLIWSNKYDCLDKNAFNKNKLTKFIQNNIDKI